MTPIPAEFPIECASVGRKLDFLSRELLPQRRFDDYVRLMERLLHERVHYVDPVHELRHRSDVLAMLAKYLPRVCNEDYAFTLIHDGEKDLVWRWTISLKIRFTWFKFVIHGLVHAEVADGRIVHQREYYDPMESVCVIPLVGRLYKLMLKFG